MSKTQLELNFKNGDIVTIPDFGKLPRAVEADKDIISHFEHIKENDLPITIKSGNGSAYESSGKELVAVKIIL